MQRTRQWRSGFFPGNDRCVRMSAQGANHGLCGRARRGFSLAELMVLVSIITVLSAIMMPSLTRSRSEGQLASCLGNLKGIGVAYQSYLADHPNTTDIGMVDPWGMLLPNYLKAVPVCPSTGVGRAKVVGGATVGYGWNFFTELDGPVHTQAAGWGIPCCVCLGGHGDLLPSGRALWAGPTYSPRCGVDDGRGGGYGY